MSTNEPAPIILLRNSQFFPLEEALALCGPEIDTVFVCDVYVTGIEKGRPIPGLSGGFECDVQGRRVVNIDHHAPDPRVERFVSSGHLALEWLSLHGPAPSSRSKIFINHTDCDSVISAALMSGRLEADARFGEAVLAADHTGAEDPIADILQALDPLRDWEFSFKTLEAHLAGKELSPKARELVTRRRHERELVRAWAAQGGLRIEGKVTALYLEKGGEHLDSAFLPSLAPAASVLVMAYPHPENPAKLVIRLRLGQNAPPELKLNRIPFDPHFGGRWNAGANKRAGGTTMSLEAYLKALDGWVSGFSEG